MRYLFSLLASYAYLAKCLIIHLTLHLKHETTCAALDISKSTTVSGFRPTQTRKTPLRRKPSGYWKDTENIENEIRSLWEEVKVKIPSDEPPPIPNETLLNYWRRHDIRYAISQFGGRDLLSVELNGAFVVPGKWKEASETVWVKQVIANDPNLDPKVPPMSPQQGKMKREDPIEKTALRQKKRWTHQTTRRKKGFWGSKQVVIEEL